MFGRLKDWRRVATRYDRCPTTFFSAIALAATVNFWLGSASPGPREVQSIFTRRVGEFQFIRSDYFKVARETERRGYVISMTQAHLGGHWVESIATKKLGFFK